MKTTAYQHKGAKRQKQGLKTDRAQFLKWMIVIAGVLIIVGLLLYS